LSVPAPIALFIFNRPRHLARTLATLQANPLFGDSPVTVFADGPRGRADESETQAARLVARDVLGSRAQYRMRDTNAGLANSIIEGVSDLVDRFGRVIVVEDDLEVAPGFLSYMNAALDRYADCGYVYQVSGYMFAAPAIAAGRRAVFLPLISTWGWGTWKRAWRAFDSHASGAGTLQNDRKLRRKFNLEGVYDYHSMLLRQRHGTGNSWGILWYWSVFRNNGLTCFPPWTLVRNTGMDGTGTHGRGSLRGFSNGGTHFSDGEILLPQEVTAHVAEIAAVREAIWRQNGGWWGQLVDRVRALRWLIVRR
jgi:hypothetical protein